MCFELSLTLSPVLLSFCRMIVMSNLYHNLNDSIFCPALFPVDNYYSVFFNYHKLLFNCSYLIVSVTS